MMKKGGCISSKPNIIIIMTDQQRADVSRREGFALDTTPFLDSMARQGGWFNHAYTSTPICAPARTSMFTGRFPNATRVRDNHALGHVVYEKDLIGVLSEKGYLKALIGKNHSHVRDVDFDYCFGLGHNRGTRFNCPEGDKFDMWRYKLRASVSLEPTPFPLKYQGPCMAVSEAQKWVKSVKKKPFFLWLTLPEPHNPYQVPEPYFSIFPTEKLPPTRTDSRVLKKKGFKWEWTKYIEERAFPGYEKHLPRVRSNYFGMLRLIDDQIKRFVEFLEKENLRKNTIIIFLSDHGDFVGEYGLMRKGPEMPNMLMRIPLFFTGPGIKACRTPHKAHVSIVDVMPTLCDALGVPFPRGVQGRSLWPMLTGKKYPGEEFKSVYAEQGIGGLHYTRDDKPEKNYERFGGTLNTGRPNFDELNSCSQSGMMRMVRKGDWKLTFDMQGNGQLYNLSNDPAELKNLYGNPGYSKIQSEMLAELLAWTLRAQDPLPMPNLYTMKTDPRNYWAKYRSNKNKSA